MRLLIAQETWTVCVCAEIQGSSLIERRQLALSSQGKLAGHDTFQNIIRQAGFKKLLQDLTLQWFNLVGDDASLGGLRLFFDTPHESMASDNSSAGAAGSSRRQKDICPCMQDDFEPSLDGRKYRKVILSDLDPGLTLMTCDGSETAPPPPRFLFERKAPPSPPPPPPPPPAPSLEQPPGHGGGGEDGVEERLAAQVMEALSLGASDHVAHEDRVDLMKLLVLLRYVAS